MRLIIFAAVLAVVVLGASSATLWAQSGRAEVASDSDEPEKSDNSTRLLHEYFDPWRVAIDGGSAAQESGAAAASPGANEIAWTPGRPPGLSLRPSADEMIFGKDGPVDPGATSTPWGPLDPGARPSRLDDATDRVDQLNYWASFEPSVVPYKRGVVQNAVDYVGGDYLLRLNAGEFREVAVEEGEARADEDAFWGSFLIRVRGGERHPIPSVAPEQRILSIQVAPAVEVRIVRDRADNFYLVPRADGLLRINMHIAAPRSYFSGEILKEVSWRDFSRAAARRDARLSPDVEKVAAQVLEFIGVSRRMSPRDALYALVEYYRNFEARPFPDELNGKDLYASISREQVGVCRHRSLAFVISARAVGIPARYVYNEAHAFVEIYWPRLGWRRIDLGGAAEEVNYSGASGADLHQTAPDALPRPPHFVSELERLRDDMAGSGASTADSGAENSDTDGEQVSQGEASAADAVEVPDTASGQSVNASQTGEAAAEVAARAASGSSEPPEPARDPRQPVRIDAVATTSEIFRGNALGLSGSLVTELGRPVGSAELKVYLGPIGAQSTEGLIPLGTLRTDAGGRFEGEFVIPDSVSIGRWSVIVRFEGDERYRPAQVD
jgi:hypothetical protein